MKYLFGDVLICKDVPCAAKLAYNDRIRKRCVTIAGDVVEPSGVLSGGSAPKEGSFLVKLKDFQAKQVTKLFFFITIF